MSPALPRKPRTSPFDSIETIAAKFRFPHQAGGRELVNELERERENEREKRQRFQRFVPELRIMLSVDYISIQKAWKI